jgi:hypothetical protein
MTGAPEALRNRLGRATTWQTLVVAAVAVALYARTIGYGFYLDDYALARPWRFREAAGTLWGQFDTSGFNDAYYRPLSSISFALEWPVWGITTWGYHLTNLALHVAASIGVLMLLRRLRIPAWCAVAGAAYFAAVPSNVATVLYIAERTDAMAALCVLVALQFVHRYRRFGSASSLVAINLCLVVALLSKEIGVAMIPAVACFWWYLGTSPTGGLAGDVTDARWSGGARPIAAAWRLEVALGWRAFSRWRTWTGLIAPMVGVVAVYLGYRTIVMPPGSLGGRFGETQNPVRAFTGGINSTFRGVPFETRALAYIPLTAAAVVAIWLRPVTPTWRVVVLGAGLVVSGVVPLTWGGAVDPRLLYVAEIGMAAVVAGLAAVLAEAVTQAGDRVRTGLTVAVAAIGVAVAALTLVSLADAQHLYRDGSDHKLDGDERIYEDPVLRGYVEPVHLATIERRLREAGRL